MEEQRTNTALLVMDMQEQMLKGLPQGGPLIERTAKAISGARNNGVPVIYVVVGFRKGVPEISSRNKTFSARAAFLREQDMEQWMKIEPQLAPAENEAVVVKRRYSAFTGSDLEVLLRGMNIHHLVLSGVVTSGVVLSTLREAADKDFQLTVLSDACLDRDPEVHTFLMEKIFPQQAEVTTVEAWINSKQANQPA
ncbi:cysteine hydrolase family protein [Chitinophaga polysaccharea]|uniref:cysteine hydrolase family protein n=1 Tax=Chitinophaga polysaccharea TaxID=1293035 RepID=UPI001158CD25|nr:isochorismatase family cysteine hydrolase [Chitinophaga polysaccharea]